MGERNLRYAQVPEPEAYNIKRTSFDPRLVNIPLVDIEFLRMNLSYFLSTLFSLIMDINK